MISHIEEEEKKNAGRYHWRQGVFGGNNTCSVSFTLIPGCLLQEAKSSS